MLSIGKLSVHTHNEVNTNNAKGSARIGRTENYRYLKHIRHFTCVFYVLSIWSNSKNQYKGRLSKGKWWLMPRILSSSIFNNLYLIIQLTSVASR